MPFVMQDKWEKNQHLCDSLLEHKQQAAAPGGSGTLREAEIDSLETPPDLDESTEKYRINI